MTSFGPLSCRPAPLLALLLSIVVLTPAAGQTPGSAPLADETAPRPIALADRYELIHVDGIVVDPSGRRVVFERSRPDRPSDSWTRELWELTLEGAPRRLIGNAGSPRFSPDGESLAVLREGQVWIVPLRGGEPYAATALSEPVTELAWAPDSRHLVVVSRDARVPAPPLLGAELERSDRVASDAGAGELDAGEWVPAAAAEADTQPRPRPPAAARPVAATEPPAESDPEEVVATPATESDRPLPRVIRRLQFKADGEGYLPARYRHLYLVELADDASGPGPVRRLTAGSWDDSAPAYSPDGRWIAYVSRRAPEPDHGAGADLWLTARGEEPIRLTDTPGTESSPVFSPDGRWLAYLHTPATPPVYGFADLRLIGLYGPDNEEPPPTESADLAPTEPFELTRQLDRPVASAPVWRPDLTALYVTVEDRGTVPLVRVGTGLTPVGVGGGGLFRRRPRADLEERGRVEAIVAGPRVVSAFALRPPGADDEDGEPRLVLAMSDGTTPVELYETPTAPLSVEMPMGASSAHLQPAIVPTAAELPPLTSLNEPLRRRLQLASPEPIRVESDPEVFVEGWVLRPPDRAAAAGLPALLGIHGGPVAQFTWGFDFYHQFLAAQGYAVVYVNPRGSSGYGLEFAHALWADWGGPDLRDVTAALDHLQERGVIDPRRLGVVGWSYGGILTNYLITRTDRFAAAVSGASETDNLAAYGVDDLQQWWEDELGLPYEPEARARYERLSAIRDVAAIEAPTLFAVGELDVRVPASQSEMIYQQLRRRMLDGGPETALVIYPGEYHLLQRPSFELDFYRRTKAWFDRFVLGDLDADPYFGERAW